MTTHDGATTEGAPADYDQGTNDAPIAADNWDPPGKWSLAERQA